MSIIFEVRNKFLLRNALISIFIQLPNYFVYLSEVSSLQYFSKFLSVQIACFILIVVIECISQKLSNEQIFSTLHYYYKLIEVDFSGFVFVYRLDYLGYFLIRNIIVYIFCINLYKLTHFYSSIAIGIDCIEYVS